MRKLILLAIAHLPLAGQAIMAGGEFALPVDSPSVRLDEAGPGSAYNFVGALSLNTGTATYSGSAVALSSHWVLTAGHNVDFDDNGTADSNLGITFSLPGYSSYTAASYLTYPDFTGFGNPDVFGDLSLLYFEDPLPSLLFPVLGLSLTTGDTLTLVGFGRSGYGSYGYTTNASTTDRRTGQNIVDSLEEQSGGTGLLYRYDFDAPDTTGTVGGSLGNTIETIIGPGDSGGAALLAYGSGYALAGINTFTEGYGGLFGDIGGGVSLEPYWDWITSTTGLELVPEPGGFAWMAGLGALAWLILRRKRSM